MRRRSSRLLAGERSALSPSMKRPRRIERVAERGDGARLAHADHQHQQRRAAGRRSRVRARDGTGAPPDRKWAVSVRQSSSTIVFARCSGITIARARLSSCATSLNSTRPAPSSASTTMKTSEAARPAGGMAGRHGPPDPDGQHEDGHQGQAAREAVRELDQHRGVGRPRHHFPVAQRPVGAAAGAGPGGAHVRAPQDDDDVPGEDEPGEAGEFGVHGRF